mgnify:CR=1 FL=1
MPNSEVLMELSGVRKTFGTTEVLHGIDLQITKGSHAVIFGPSGSGKSTVLRCMNLLEEPDVGSIKFLGNEYGPGTGNKSDGKRGKPIELRRKVGMVFQQFNLFPHMTALANVMEGLRTVRGMALEAARQLAMVQLDRVGLADKADSYPARLSGGQKQRLSIARSLLAKPSILILDEAASALDPESESIFIRNLSRIAVGRTVVMISHRLSTLVNADAILVMQNGQLVDSGRHSELLTRCETYQTLWNQQTSHM